MRILNMCQIIVTAAMVALVSPRQNVVDSAKPLNQFLLSRGTAGSIEIGQPVDEVYQAVGRGRVRLVDLFKEGFFSPALEISLPGSSVRAAIVADIREWPCPQFSVWGIDVRDPRFRTGDDLGVGSTIADLRQKYAVRISHAEGESAIVDALQMSFKVNSDANNNLTRIVSVWIWPDPDGVRQRRCPGR